jgi:hypothetical protein
LKTVEASFPCWSIPNYTFFSLYHSTTVYKEEEERKTIDATMFAILIFVLLSITAQLKADHGFDVRHYLSTVTTSLSLSLSL